MHQQALALPVKWDGVNGGWAETGREELREEMKGGDEFNELKDMAAMGELPPAHGIDTVHLAQWEMTADYSAIPLCTSVLPHVLRSSQKHNLSIYQRRREGNRESDRCKGSKQERQEFALM